MISLIFSFIYSVLFCYFLWVILDSFYHYCHIPHYRVKRKPIKETGFLYHLFFTVPRDIAYLIEDKKSDEFKEHGFILFTGKQGSGKTMAMTYYINRLILKYPDVLIGTNYGLLCQDFELTDYHQLFEVNNGLQGVIFGFDEIQATFSSRNWKDNFDPSLLSAICQNRKAHRLIYGTCQNIQLVDKSIRIQSMLYAKTFTFLGFITLVVFFEPEYDFEGNLEKSKLKKFKIFFQDDVLRYQYNTFDLIKSIK